MKVQALIIPLLFLILQACQPGKPAVWIFTDMSDPALPGENHMGTINDPDDVSAMAGYLLMANEFNTLGIVISSTHRKEHKHTPDQSEWANAYFGTAYASDLPGLQKHIGGYPEKLSFMQSSIKETGERFEKERDYTDLTGYETVSAFLEVVGESGEVINVLCWGSLTEPAIFASHCLATGQDKLLKKVRFIAHWTNSSLHQGTPDHPEHVANCREDADACAYLKMLALERKLDYFECGAIGQHGIVSGGPKGEAYYDQFRVSKLGEIFASGKFVHNGVDHSDAATYWTLLKGWGVDLDDLHPDGSNDPDRELNNETKFRDWSENIHNELLRRAQLASDN